MKTFTATIVLAGFMALAMGGQGQAQELALRRATQGEPAMLNKSMTQTQARRLCTQQMRGAREGRAAIRSKMSICMNKYMNGM